MPDGLGEDLHECQAEIVVQGEGEEDVGGGEVDAAAKHAGMHISFFVKFFFDILKKDWKFINKDFFSFLYTFQGFL